MPTDPTPLMEEERRARVASQPLYTNVSLQAPAYDAGWNAARDFYKAASERERMLRKALKLLLAEREGLSGTEDREDLYELLGLGHLETEERHDGGFKATITSRGWSFIRAALEATDG